MTKVYERKVKMCDCSYESLKDLLTDKQYDNYRVIAVNITIKQNYYVVFERELPELEED